MQKVDLYTCMSLMSIKVELLNEALKRSKVINRMLVVIEWFLPLNK
jgi:hypothetical protein